jgi:FkbM family methyltransferase
MLDVGAHHGASLAPFADDGWEIHAFEPDPANRAQLQSAFGSRPNVTIVPAAVSDEAGEMTLYTSEVSTGVSSLAAFTGDHRPTCRVPVITTAQYLAEAAITAVDFMKIDVEGFERNVLDGHDWAVKPEMIVLEFEDAKTVALGYTWNDLAGELVTRGYEVLVSEWFPVQRYGGPHRWRRLARYPTDLASAGAWGNLIAATDLAAVLPVARRAIGRYRLRRRIERVVRLRSATAGSGRARS